jgi:hypothetical protein
VRETRLQWLVVLAAVASGPAACAMLSGISEYSKDAIDAGGKIPPDETSVDNQPDVNADEPGDDDDGISESGGPVSEGGVDASPDDAADGASDADATDDVGPPEGGGEPDAGQTPDGSGGDDAGCLSMVHSNGQGQTYFDCSPPMTYTETEAQKACVASTVDAAACSANTTVCSIFGGETVICSTSCVCWGYTGGAMGHVNTGGLGHVCTCPGQLDPTWN